MARGLKKLLAGSQLPGLVRRTNLVRVFGPSPTLCTPMDSYTMS